MVVYLFTIKSVGVSQALSEVGQDEVRQVTMHGQAGGIAVAATSDLYVYKLNESTNQYEQQSVSKNWVVAYLLGGKGKDTSFDLTEGKWVFLMAPGEGIAVLTGYSIKLTKDVTLDYADAESVSGTASGNILTDDDPKYGQDKLPAGTLLTSVNGTAVSEDGPTVIEGQYGTLTINADGSYDYTVNEDFRGPYGSEDTFTYVVTSPAGNSSSAELNIQLNIIPADQRVEVDAIVVVEIEPTIILDTPKINDATGFDVLKVGVLGPVLGASVLGGEGVMEFTVDENQARELTFQGNAGGLSVGVTHDLAIYKLDETTGDYVQVHYEDGWFTVYLLGGVSDKLKLQFGEGEYRAIVIPKGGLSVLTGTGLKVVEDKLYDYDAPTKFVGQIDGDATVDEGTVLLKVGDQVVEPGKATVVQGAYGQLTINIDGTYEYSIVKPADAGSDWKPPYGEIDSFRLVTQDANGKSIVENLNIKISTHNATDDFNDATVEEQNLETTDKVLDGVSAATTKVSKDFTVTENTLSSLKIDIGTTTSATRLEYSVVNKVTGEVVATNQGSASRSLNVTIVVVK